MRSLYTRFLHLENHLHHRLVQHSITALRIAVGAVFLGFGILKYFPGVSPAAVRNQPHLRGAVL